MPHVRGEARTPLISVIVPVFNRAHTLQQALDSISAQEFRNYELIVVDDGSTDGSAGIIGTAWRGDCRIIHHPNNRGAAAARNSGIAAAKGHYIAFLDSDDCWHENKLAEQIAALDGERPDVKACATGYYLHKGKRVSEICPSIPPGGFRKQIVFGCTISPGTTLLVERSVFDEIGTFDETLSRLEDWDWLLRYAERYDIVFLPKPLASVHSRLWDEPVLSAAIDPILESLRRIGKKHVPELRREGRIRLRQFQSTLCVEFAARMYRRGEPIRAAIGVFRSLVYYPFRDMSFFRSLWRSVISLITERRHEPDI